MPPLYSRPCCPSYFDLLSCFPQFTLSWYETEFWFYVETKNHATLKNSMAILRCFLVPLKKQPCRFFKKRYHIPWPGCCFSRMHPVSGERTNCGSGCPFFSFFAYLLLYLFLPPLTIKKRVCRSLWCTLFSYSLSYFAVFLPILTGDKCLKNCRNRSPEVPQYAEWSVSYQSKKSNTNTPVACQAADAYF